MKRRRGSASGKRSLFLSFKDYFRLFFRLLQLWIKKNEILTIVLRENLHQPQYVEKLENILLFIIRQKALNQADLDAIWAAQVATETIRFVCKFYACSRLEGMRRS